MRVGLVYNPDNLGPYRRQCSTGDMIDRELADVTCRTSQRCVHQQTQNNIVVS